MSKTPSQKIKKTNQLIAALSVLLVAAIALGLYSWWSSTNTATNPETGITAPAESERASFIAYAKTQAYTLYTDLEQGSGFLINNKGDLLTNAHVVLDGSFVTVKNSNGQEFNGVVIGISESDDLALVRVDQLAGKEPLPIEMEPVEVGTPVIAIGSPYDVNNTVTTGEIAATGVDFSDDFEYAELYEMTAEIAQGSSGGPLIDTSTEKILGINSIILQEHPESGYAIPLYTIWDLLTEWISSPLVTEEQEIILQDLQEPYFEEDLLANFLTDYVTTLPTAFNDMEATDHLAYLTAQGEDEEADIIDAYVDPQRIYSAAEPIINTIDFNDTSATIEAETQFTYHEPDSESTATVTQPATYTITINQYGDYQIEHITIP